MFDRKAAVQADAPARRRPAAGSSRCREGGRKTHRPHVSICSPVITCGEVIRRYLEKKVERANLNDLKRDIIITLGVEMIRAGMVGPVNIRKIYMGYSDLPAETITSAIDRLEEEKAVFLSRGRRQIAITDKGLKQIQTL